MTCAQDPDEVRLLLSWYAEDVLRSVEMEVKGLEARIRLKYPEARYIELEPDGGKNIRATEALRYAIDIGSNAADVRQSEIEQLYSLEKYFGEEKHKQFLKESLEYSPKTSDTEEKSYSYNDSDFNIVSKSRGESKIRFYQKSSGTDNTPFSS